MRKLFLIAGILSVSALSAQDNNFEDFQKHFQKAPPVKKLPPPALPQPTVEIRGGQLLQQPMTYSHMLPDGSMVVNLSQDNMPCVMPQMQQFNMPNAGSREQLNPGRGAIPNPVRPPVTKLEKMVR